MNEHFLKKLPEQMDEAFSSFQLNLDDTYEQIRKTSSKSDSVNGNSNNISKQSNISQRDTTEDDVIVID